MTFLVALPRSDYPPNALNSFRVRDHLPASYLRALAA